MSSKNTQKTTQQGAPKITTAPAPAPAPSETPAADQTLTSSEGAQEPTTGEGAASIPGDAGTAEFAAGTSSTTAQPGEQTGPLGDAVTKIEDGAAALTGTSGTVTSAAAPVAAPAPAPAAAAPVAKAAAPTGAFSAEAQALISSFTTSAAKNGFAELAEYLKAMAPGRQMDPLKGAQHQVSLYRTLQLLLNQSGDEFPKVFGTLLKVFDEHSLGALGGQRVFRFTDNIALSRDDRFGFERLLNLLVHTANPQGRAAAVKTIDFPRTLQFGVTEDTRRKILGYFNK